MAPPRMLNPSVAHAEVVISEVVDVEAKRLFHL